MEAKGRILHLYDGTGWVCDVPCTAEQWAFYKRAARRERMRVADWLRVAIVWGAASLIAKHEAKAKGE
jgi:hypothetical protein